MNPPKTAIVIPVYNHSGTLREVAQRAGAIHRPVIVVDDGSLDQPRNALEGLDVHFIRHRRNMGKGAAILTGTQKARELGRTHIITLDADGQHDPDDIPLFLKQIKTHPTALVIGKRDFKTHYAPASSRVGRRISNFWFLVETGRLIGDAQSGFRAYPIRILEALTLRERHYTFEIEVLVKAAWAGLPLREVNVSTHYAARDERISHFHLFKDNVRLSFLNARLFMRALIPLPHKKLVNRRHG
ncbi:MAG: glycosyltransferase family 2 protein [Deltaproteobacteria bacterium]|nr:glycosyltransferase family 2 protein [Deltaproteobacteria bacterium]